MTLDEMGSSASRSWFALRVKSRSEKAVAAMARHKGFEEFLPVYRCGRRWSDRVKSVELPLFPGYVFCHMNAQYRLPLLTIPGALHFVGIGKIPVAIDDAEIEAIRFAVSSGLAAEPWPYLNVGQEVRLEQGPLAGLEGILVESRKEQRIVVSVALLKRSVAVEIERHWVTPLGLNSREAAIRPIASAIRNSPPSIPSSAPEGRILRPRDMTMSAPGH